MDDDLVTEARRQCAISVLGGPTTVVDIAGYRIVMDPTFDPPGPHSYLTRRRDRPSRPPRSVLSTWC